MSNKTVFSATRRQGRASVAPGTRLNGLYEVERQIAAGGMGEIYRGRLVSTGDPVAIKMIKPEFAEDEAMLALLLKEASALHNLTHDNIVRYFIFATDPTINRAYLAMEFVEGVQLADLLRDAPLSLEKTIELCRTLAGALQAAHDKSIIHRDISPDNIIVPDGDMRRSKIIDFGIARSTKPGGKTVIGDGFAGKYNYVSPEQLGMYGGDITPRSDIYSLALMLVECLLGKPLDMGGTIVEVTDKRRAVPDLSGIDARVRPMLEEMLAPDPANRPASMREVAERFGKSPPPVETRAPARPRTTRTPSQPEPGKSPIGLVAAGVAGVLALGVAGYLVLGSGGAPPAPSPPPAVVLAPPPAPAATPTPAPVQPQPSATPSDSGPGPAPGPATQTREAALPPPAVAPPAPALPVAPAVPGAPAMLAAEEHARRIANYVRYHDADACLFLRAMQISPTTARLEALATTRDTVRAFQLDFQRVNGFLPEIAVSELAPAQCGAVAFLHQIDAATEPAIAMRAARPSLRSGEAVDVTLSGLDGRTAALWQIDADGVVSNLTPQLRRQGLDSRFSGPLTGARGTALLLALVSQEALPEPARGTRVNDLASLGNELRARKVVLSAVAQVLQIQ